MNEKLYAIMVSLLIGSACGGIILGVALGTTYLFSSDIRTEEECKELQGTMRESENTKEFLSRFPEDGDKLQSENCLEGLKNYKDNTELLITFFSISAFTITFATTMQFFYPRKGDEK